MIDLRSDTVTRPTEEMRAAMASAEVGDDVYGEDPTVNRFEELAAERLGKEAALMVTSGTQGNLVSILAHCGRGDEYIVGRGYHSFVHEGGGAAVLGGVKPEPLEVNGDGTVSPKTIRAAIKPDDDPHYARTRLVALENPIDGKALGVDYLREVTELAQDNGLATHLDGARMFNAATALGVGPDVIADAVDTVMFSLSKGLGAPVGAVVCGPEDFVDEARRWRKVVGGGWRQAGVLAAAGRYALENHVERLSDDHENARRLAEGLVDIPGVEVDLDDVETNMVFAELTVGDVDELTEFLQQHDVLVHPREPLRLVTHIDVSRDDVDRALRAFRAYVDSL